MKFHLLVAACAALFLTSVAGTSHAEDQPQGVLVYYGTAQFVGGGGVVVGPFSNGDVCNDALDQAIADKVEQFGYVVDSVSPCWPRWSFKDSLPAVEAAPGDFTLYVGATLPGESLAVTRMLLKEVRDARAAYRAAEYEAVLTAIYRAAIQDDGTGGRGSSRTLKPRR